LERIFPIIKEMQGVEQGPYHHLDVWLHSLETLKELEEILEELSTHSLLGEKIRNYLRENLGGTRERAYILKLGALFHDIGKPRTKEITPEGKVCFIGHEKIGVDLVKEISERLKFSSKEENSLVRLIQFHLRPGSLVESQNISAKAKFRFFRAAEEESVGLILIGLADKEATRGPLTTEENQLIFKDYLIKLIEDYFYQKELVKPKRLLDGYEVMQILNIPPGPLVGEILKELEEVQVEKKINNKEEAEKFIRMVFKSK